MLGLLARLKEAESTESDSLELTHLLHEINKEITVKAFKGIEPETLQGYFNTVLTFFLMCASVQSSSTRLSAYRATGIFLMKMAPFYPKSLQKAFSDVSMMSTVDVKNSVIIASAFAFISSRISPLDLEDYLMSTPVYHHFTTYDPLFAEHLANIISNLGHLGLEWHSTLLTKLLVRLQVSPDRSIYRAIAAVVGNFPQQLMKEVLHGFQMAQLPLVSFLLSRIKLDMSQLDFEPVISSAIQSLTHPALLDSSLEVLSHYKDVRVKIEGNEVTIFTESYKNTLTLESLKSKPAFYSLSLPTEYLLPDPADPPSIVSAKEGGLTNVPDLFSPSPTSIRMLDSNSLPVIVKMSLLSTGKGWLQDLEILKLVARLPRGYVKALLKDNFKDFREWTLNKCMSLRDAESAAAKAALVTLIDKSDFHQFSFHFAKKVDPFDPILAIEALTYLLNEYPNEDKSHLLWLASSLLESLDPLEIDSSLHIALCDVLTAIGAHKLPPSQVQPFFLRCMSVICAGYEEFTAVAWETPWPSRDTSQARTAVYEDLVSRSVDITSDSILNPRDYFRPLYASVKFAFSFSIPNFGKTFALTVCEKLTRIFPMEVARFMEENWTHLSPVEQANVVKKHCSTIGGVSDLRIAAIWSELHGKVPYSLASKAAGAIFANLTKRVFENSSVVPSEALMKFRALSGLTEEIDHSEPNEANPEWNFDQVQPISSTSDHKKVPLTQSWFSSEIDLKIRHLKEASLLPPQGVFPGIIIERVQPKRLHAALLAVASSIRRGPVGEAEANAIADAIEKRDEELPPLPLARLSLELARIYPFGPSKRVNEVSLKVLRSLDASLAAFLLGGPMPDIPLSRAPSSLCRSLRVATLCKNSEALQKLLFDHVTDYLSIPPVTYETACSLKIASSLFPTALWKKRDKVVPKNDCASFDTFSIALLDLAKCAPKPSEGLKVFFVGLRNPRVSGRFILTVGEATKGTGDKSLFTEMRKEWGSRVKEGVRDRELLETWAAVASGFDIPFSIEIASLAFSEGRGFLDSFVPLAKRLTTSEQALSDTLIEQIPCETHRRALKLLSQPQYKEASFKLAMLAGDSEEAKNLISEL